MASGHVNRTKRPNTWLHRPASKREEKPCQLGAVHTWHFATFGNTPSSRPLTEAKRTCRDEADMSAFGGKADIHGRAASTSSVANDPKRATNPIYFGKSGRQ
jgi:hypothetical protein